MENIGIINVSVSNHYREPSSQSEVVTQGRLGEQVTVLDRQETHTLIEQADTYQSWIPEDQLVTDIEPAGGENVTVISHFLRIYSQADKMSSVIRDAVVGSQLVAAEEKGDWFRIVLPDGTFGWAEKNILARCRRFLPEVSFLRHTIFLVIPISGVEQALEGLTAPALSRLFLTFMVFCFPVMPGSNSRKMC